MTSAPPPPSTFPTLSAPIAQVHTNLNQEIIQITDDKLRLALDEHMRKREDSRNWMGPFGILLAVIIVFCSSEFKTAFGIPAATWQALFLVMGVIAFVSLINTAIRIFRSPTTDSLMNRIKNLTS